MHRDMHAVFESEPHEPFQTLWRLSPRLLLQPEMSAIRLATRKAQGILYAGPPAVRSNPYVAFRDPLSARPLTRAHARTADEQMAAVRGKDLKFLDEVILAELRKHHARLSAHPSKLTLVDFNLVRGQVNVVFDARGANANPFGIKCGCEMLANTRWKHMAEVVREGKKPMVLIRTFISGGWSRKIVLQAIPLSVVLEGGRNQRRKGQTLERYLFNLMFTCCGSEGNGTRELRGAKGER